MPKLTNVSWFLSLDAEIDEFIVVFAHWRPKLTNVSWFLLILSLDAEIDQLPRDENTVFLRIFGQKGLHRERPAKTSKDRQIRYITALSPQTPHYNKIQQKYSKVAVAETEQLSTGFCRQRAVESL